MAHIFKITTLCSYKLLAVFIIYRLVLSSCKSKQWLDSIRVRARVRIDNGETMHSGDDVDFVTLT